MIEIRTIERADVERMLADFETAERRFLEQHGKVIRFARVVTQIEADGTPRVYFLADHAPMEPGHA